MSRKIKGFALDSKSRMEEAKARSRHLSLMQDYEDLQKEVDAMRSRLDAAKQRKLILAAEVRFLRRRHRCLVEARTTHSIQERPTTVTHPNQPKIAKKKQPIARKEASKRGLVTNPKKQRKVVASMESNGGHNKRMKNGNGKEGSRRSLPQTYSPLPDLNQDNAAPRAREPSLRLGPSFDLNEISTGDEDFYLNAEVNGLKGMNDEQQSDLKVSSVCRNSGEGSSRAGKRKISWQDPVALRV